MFSLVLDFILANFLKRFEFFFFAHSELHLSVFKDKKKGKHLNHFMTYLHYCLFLFLQGSIVQKHIPPWRSGAIGRLTFIVHVQPWLLFISVSITSWSVYIIGSFAFLQSSSSNKTPGFFRQGSAICEAENATSSGACAWPVVWRKSSVSAALGLRTTSREQRHRQTVFCADRTVRACVHKVLSTVTAWFEFSGQSRHSEALSALRLILFFRIH